AAVSTLQHRPLVVHADRLAGPARDELGDGAGIGGGALASGRTGAGEAGRDQRVAGLAGIDRSVVAGGGAVGIGRVRGRRRPAPIVGDRAGDQDVGAGQLTATARGDVGRAAHAVVTGGGTGARIARRDRHVARLTGVDAPVAAAGAGGRVRAAIGP